MAQESDKEIGERLLNFAAGLGLPGVVRELGKRLGLPKDELDIYTVKAQFDRFRILGPGVFEVPSRREEENYQRFMQGLPSRYALMWQEQTWENEGGALSLRNEDGSTLPEKDILGR